MKYIADLHVHSSYSRATSKKSDLAGHFAWARAKGIQVVGTGDFTHPGWMAELKKGLKEAEPGFFALRDEKVPAALPGVKTEEIPVRFALTSEISSIYKRGGKVRKVHNILHVPDFESAEKISSKLAAIGNIESDGRPILGLDSRDLLEILLERAPEGFLIPAHIWTPWFSIFGSKSGFDSIEECFGDLTEHIFALETGLSSDPEMIRMISALDSYALVSNSDCHSPSKLGREANLFNTGFDFFSLREALKNPAEKGFAGTVEFFPEEGKYHMDGHRKCGVCLDPVETAKNKFACPECGSPVTVGVMHRVMDLADRKKPLYPEGNPNFSSLIPLTEILSEITGVGPNSKKVLNQYAKVISSFGSEFNVFFNAPIEDIEKNFSPILGEAIRRARKGQVIKNPGFDGRFGVIKLFEEGEISSLSGQISFLSPTSQSKDGQYSPSPINPQNNEKTSPTEAVSELNPEQKKAVDSRAEIIMVSAGPGTGKTFTLVSRLAALARNKPEDCGSCFALTFTNRAASELKERLGRISGAPAAKIFAGTFHSFCLLFLRRYQPDLAVAGREKRQAVLRKLFPDEHKKLSQVFDEEIERHYLTENANLDKSGEDKTLPEKTADSVERYIEDLQQQNAVDLAAVIPYFVNRLSTDERFKEEVSSRVKHLFIDEFQDLNSRQYQLTRILAAKSRVFAIGDPNQAIYGFRGCRPEFFHQFSEEFKAENIRLFRNYRCAPEIAEAASAIIKHNSSRDDGLLVPEKTRNIFLEYFPAPSPQAEADFIVREIERLLGGVSHLSIAESKAEIPLSPGTGFKDIAVLYRQSGRSEALAEKLRKKGLPFQLTDAKPFFKDPDIRAAYYWTQAAGDPASFEHLYLLEGLKGIGKTSIRNLENALPMKFADFFKEAERARLTSAIRGKLDEVQYKLAEFRKKAASQKLTELLPEVYSYLKIDASAPNAERYLELAGTFGKDLAGFAEHLRRNAALTVYDERAEAISLMTVHAAKGLEFPVVFMAGLEDGVFPSVLPGRETDWEEERRLFYVGLTRAKDRLTLTYSLSGTVYGVSSAQIPSRFIKEIPNHILRKADIPKAAPRKQNPGVQMSF